MINFYELEDVTLIPTVTNVGRPDERKLNFYVQDSDDVTGINKSLPIFTSPMEAIIGSGNSKVFSDSGIRPIIPGTEPIEIRLELCQWIFCAFSPAEIDEYFIKVRRAGMNQFHLCIDAGNGHDVRVLEMGLRLRQMYQNQVLLMGGNVALPEVYKDYSTAGFNYVRYGIASGSLINREKYGFHYPMASLLDDLKNYRISGAGKGLRHVKVIADGGIKSFSDIIKAIACGADYVMVGSELARVIEAAGSIFRMEKGEDGEKHPIEINPGAIRDWPGGRAKMEGLQRRYYGNTTPEVRARRAGYDDPEDWRKDQAGIMISDASWNWIQVDYSLGEWIDDFKECSYYAFMMTSSCDWNEFKRNVKYGILK